MHRNWAAHPKCLCMPLTARVCQLTTLIASRRQIAGLTSGVRSIVRGSELQLFVWDLYACR